MKFQIPDRVNRLAPKYAPHRFAPWAQRVYEMRRRMGFDHDAMGEYLGVPVQTYRKWENGERLPHSSAEKVADLLELIRRHAPALHRTLAMQALEKGGYDDKL